MCSSAFTGWTWLVTSVVLAAVTNYWKDGYWKPWDNRGERDKRLLSLVRITAILKGVPRWAGEMGTYQKLCRHNWQQEMKQFNDVKGSLYRWSMEDNMSGRRGALLFSFSSSWQQQQQQQEVPESEWVGDYQQSTVNKKSDLKRLWAPSGSKNSELGQQKQECTLKENTNVLFHLGHLNPFSTDRSMHKAKMCCIFHVAVLFYNKTWRNRFCLPAF